MTTPHTISPRQLAQAMGVSESSIKRWADKGMVRIIKTKGGHRRIPIDEAVQLIRDTPGPLVDPAALGIDGIIQPSELESNSPQEDMLYQALLDGDDKKARGLLLAMYLQGHAIERLFDGLIARAMHRIGELWTHDDRGIYIEHRATDICVQIINQLRLLLSTDNQQNPVAIGGTLEEDPYILPSMMAATSLASAGWREVNLGAHLPLSVLNAAASQYDAKLVWLSISVCESHEVAGRSLRQWADELSTRQIQLVVGGRNCPPHNQLIHPNIQRVESMSELVAYGKGFIEAARK